MECSGTGVRLDRVYVPFSEVWVSGAGRFGRGRGMTISAYVRLRRWERMGRWAWVGAGLAVATAGVLGGV